MSAQRISRVATVPFFLLHHLGGQIRYLARMGAAVDVVCSSGPECAELESMPGVRLFNVEIPRKISLLADLAALVSLWRLFRRGRYAIVHSTTPKAGLLCAVAAKAAGVPLRLHTFTGQPWMEMRGIMRWVARTCDRLIVSLNTQCYADSASQRDYLIAEGIASGASLHVLGQGSLAGVDVARWERARRDHGGAAARAALGIPDGVPVIVFVGRVTRDKGVLELLRAFWNLLARGADAALFVVGPRETSGDLELERELERAAGNERIRLTGYIPKPEMVMALADILCLPSYREGFGNVVIEAAAMGVPAVGTSIVGLTDSIADGSTGILVAPKDPRALADALFRLLVDTALRARMGHAAHERAKALFDADRVNALVYSEYERLHARQA